MIRTLLKHEFLRTKGLLGAVFGVDLTIVAVALVMSMTGFPVLAPFGHSVVVLASVALTPAVMLALGHEHWRSSFSGRGYLTHSLPVRGRTQVAVSLAHSYLWSLVSLLVCAGVRVLGVAAKAIGQRTPVGERLHVLGGELHRLAAQASAGWWTAIVLFILLALFGYLTQIWFAAAVGSERRMAGTGWGPIAVFVALYLALQVATGVCLFAVPLVLHLGGTEHLQVHTANIMRLLSSREESMMPLGILVPVVVAPFILLWRTFKSWDERVSMA